MTTDRMKIALVNPRVESLGSMIPPLGLLWVAAVLDQNEYDVRIFDIYPYNDDDFALLRDWQPDLIGMTLLTDYWSRASQVAQFVRAEIPDAKFVVGGVHVTMLPEQSLSGLNADVGVIGEGEYTMLELCNCIRDDTDWHEIQGIAYIDDNGSLVQTARRDYIEDLDSLPFPARHLLNFDEYLIPPGIVRGYWSERSTVAMTSRGCPFHCIWCGSNCTFGYKVRRRSVDNVMAEVEQLVRDYKLDTLYFIDDTFTLNKRWVLEFCEKLRERNYNIAWGCQAHVETVEEEMLRAMKDAGLVQLDMGVESGSEKVLQALKKKSKPETVKRAFEIARKVGVRTMASFVLGAPTETHEDIEATMQLAREINPDYASAYYLTPYPGTELMSMAEENGWLVTDDRARAGLRRGPMMLINFTEHELAGIRSRFQKMFAYRNVLSVVFSPQYIFRAMSMAIRYPLGFFWGLKRYVKTLAIDDFFFEFYNYYLQKRSRKKRSASSRATK